MGVEEGDLQTIVNLRDASIGGQIHHRGRSSSSMFCLAIGSPGDVVWKSLSSSSIWMIHFDKEEEPEAAGLALLSGSKVTGAVAGLQWWIGISLSLCNMAWTSTTLPLGNLYKEVDKVAEERTLWDNLLRQPPWISKRNRTTGTELAIEMKT